MVGNRIYCRLENAMAAIIDYRGKTPRKASSGIPLITAKVVKGGRIKTPTEFIAKADYSSWMRRGIPRSGDVVVTTEAPLGEVAQLTDQCVALAQRLILLRGKSGILDNRFLKFLMQSDDVQDQLRARATGTTVLGIKQKELREIELALPPLPEQRAIAHILGTLDDKIELNRRMNETLEAMARALFKSWFVDFDPVRAKAALKRSSLITPPLRGSRQAKGASPQGRRWGEIKRRYSPQTLRKARTLRQARTDAEGLLWHFLRNKQLDGYKFRRQQPIGPYIADFACLSRKLLIEVDGSQDAERYSYDEKRDNLLQEKGYRILRFWNNEVFEHCLGVLEQVYEALTSPPPHQPSPVGSASACLSCGRRQATPPRGGSDWSVERARAYLENMDKSVVDLFTDLLVDSELGPMPKGWGIKPLGAIVDVVGGTTPSTKVLEYWKGGTHCWATPKDLSNLSSPVLLDTDRKITDAGLEKIGSGLLPPGTVLLSSRAPIGYLAISEEPVAINQGFIAMPPKDGISNLYLLHWCTVFHEEIINHANGSTFLEISKGNFRRIPMVRPSEAVMSAFDDHTRGIYGRIVSNDRESRKLTAQRDALLPKLISGNVRIK